jgi:hypothetical protein
MNPSVFVLLSCLSCVFAVSGCATDPTPQQQLVTNAAARGATLTYIKRGKTAVEQIARAQQIFEIAKQVRAVLSKDGQLASDLSGLARQVNSDLQKTGWSEADKQLAQAFVSEMIFLAEDQLALTGGNIGADRATAVLNLLTQAERAAWVFVPHAGT